MKSYVINFIRHGLTEANVNGQYAGVSNIPVCEEGKQRLKALKNNYQYPKVGSYYSSPLVRCRQTCDIIYPGVSPIIIDDLKECNFGDWEMKTPKDLEGNQMYNEWLKSGQQLKPPNGESGIDFKNRICTAVEKLIETLMREGTTSSAVFAHGGVIMMILSKYGLPKMSPFNLIVANGCGYSIRVTPSLWMRDKVFEICDRLPLGFEGKLEGKFKEMIDHQKDAVE